MMRARPTLELGVLLRAVGKSRRGHAAVELALMASPLFVFIFGIMEMGRTMWLQNALDYSVAEAARWFLPRANREQGLPPRSSRPLAPAAAIRSRRATRWR